RYCTEMKVGEWEETMKNITRATMQDFFLWVCERYRIRSWGTSLVYIRQFQQLHTTINGRYTDRNDIKELYKYHDRVLIPTFELRAPNIDGKLVLNVDSLKVILIFNIAYDTSIFPSERQRVNLSGCYMIICYTGVRPAELVHNERKPPKNGSLEKLFGRKGVMVADDDDEADWEKMDDISKKVCLLLQKETSLRGRPKALCYEDILMMIVRHPVTGRGVLAMSIKFIHHKGCDNKPKPTIFFFFPAKKVLFCPLLLFLGLALSDHAFDAPSIKGAASVLSSGIPDGLQCIPLRWKETKKKIPFFRRVSSDGTLSEDEAMLYATLRDNMGRQSLDLGSEKKWTPRAGRRGAANAANGDAPDAVRDQMMRHDPRFFTFHCAYLNENAKFDFQNCFLEDEKEDQLFRLLAHVSLTRDPRATRDMVPPEVWANLQPDPEITALEERRAELKQGQYRFDGQENETEIRKLTDTIRSKKQQRAKRVVKDYREFYFYHRPTWDFERQARGEVVEQYTEPAIDLVIPERARLAKLLRSQPENLSNEERIELSIEMVDCYIALCSKRETVKRKRILPPADDGYPTSKRIKAEVELKPIRNSFPLLIHPNQCSECAGNEQLIYEERTFKYCRPTKRNDHFDDQYLEAMERTEQRRELIVCYECKDVELYSVDHFRNYVQLVHSFKLRIADQVQKRRAQNLKRKQSKPSS
ncbi:hypothetical protein M406DRAFT_250781, partial [Cryphonectria parasitica EP155]